MLTRLFKRFGLGRNAPSITAQQPERRVRALGQLDAIDDAPALLEIARRDPDPAVRQAGTERLTNGHDLLELMEEPEMMASARRRLAVLISEGLDPLALAGTLDGPASLRHLLDAVADPRHWQPLLERLEGDDLLADVASHHPLAPVRRAAATRLVGEPALKQVERAVRDRDKVVMRLMRTRLEALRKTRQTLVDVDERLSTLASDMVQLARSEQEPRLAERLGWLCGQRDQLLAERDALAEPLAAFQLELPPPPAALTEFDARARALQDALDAARAEEEARIEAIANEVGIREDQKALVASMEHLITQMSERLADHAAPASELSVLRAAVDLEKGHWRDLTGHLSADPELVKRQARAAKTLDALVGALERLDALPTLPEAGEPTPEGAATPPPADRAEQAAGLRHALTELAWPEAIAVPAPVRQVQAALERLEAARTKVDDGTRQLEEQSRRAVARLERALERGNLGAAGRIRSELDGLLERLPADRYAKTRQRAATVTERMDELVDWQQYATTPKRLELCADMESLAAATDLAPEPRAARVKHLREQWNGLGQVRGDDGPALAARFDTAAEAAFAPCRSFFEEQAERHRATSEQRTRICDELEGFLDGYDWAAPDWRAVEKIYQEARREWRRYADADPRERSLERRYHALTRRLRNQLEPRWKANIATKEALVAAAETLAENTAAASEDAGSAAAARKLQADWKAVDITPRSADRKLWSAFREACDRIFARLGELKAEQQASIEAELDNLEARTGQLREALAALGPRTLRERSGAEDLPMQGLDALVATVASATPAAAERSRINRALGEARTALDTIRSLEIERQRGDRLLALERALTLADTAQGAEPAELPDAGWPGAWQKAWAERGHRAGDDELRREACIDLELALGLDSPEEDAALRMQRQVFRLETGLRGTDAGQADPLEQAVRTLLATPPASSAGAELGLRARAAVSRELDASPTARPA